MSFSLTTAKALGTVPYTPSYEKEVSWRRQQYGIEGIAIDRLLWYAGIPTPTEVYPPPSREAFLKLIEDIESIKSTDVAKSRAILYIFLDFSQEPNPKQPVSVAEYYGSELWISHSEMSFVKALWLLDHSQPESAIELLGEPWDFCGQESLQSYIVTSLFTQKPSLCANYLAARGEPNTYVDELAKSLALRGKFAEVAGLAREHRRPEYLKEIAKVAVEYKEKSLELVQLPLKSEEWQIVQDELQRIITTASPSLGDVNSTTTQASNIILVRALNTGDSLTLQQMNSPAWMKNAV